MENEVASLLETPKLSPLQTMRHSCSHVMAHAITRLYPGAEFGVGPDIENGFYYDVKFPEAVDESILPKIEVEMRKIIKEGRPFVRNVLPREKAIRYFGDKGQHFKLELIKDLDLQQVGTYTEGDFTDMCQGPHVASTKEIKAFKLTHMAGAYWRGNEKNDQMQRVYGVAFETKKES